MNRSSWPFKTFDLGDSDFFPDPIAKAATEAAYSYGHNTRPQRKFRVQRLKLHTGETGVMITRTK